MGVQSKYQERAWSASKAVEESCKTDSDFSSISGVRAADGGKQLDEQESFVYAEVLKYIHLIRGSDKEYQTLHSGRESQISGFSTL